MPQFTSPPNPDVFYNQVWEIARQIPRGKVASYGQIAKMIPPPAGVEIETYVAFGARVVNSKGEISQRDGAGARRQRLLLEEEDVFFSDRGRIYLKQYGWKGLQGNAAQETMF